MSGVDHAYADCLDRIFESFFESRPARAGRHDRETRDPRIILDIARAEGLLPAPGRTLRITGSKGKGTVARLAAAWLGAQPAPGLGRIGLFVSPNEVEQRDRIRIDGEPIGEADFVRIYESLEPRLRRAASSLREGQYLSPFGTFLLIALAWFRENGVDWFVLEGGRGAAYDEVGRLPGDVAVVTSIFLEHAQQIGPELRDVALNKMAIAEGAKATVLGPDVPAVLDQLGLELPQGAAVVAPPPAGGDLPGWCRLDLDIADTACRKLLALNGLRPLPAEVPIVTASFGQVAFEGRPLVYDATISFPAFDREHFAGLRRKHPRLLVVLSLSDQKDAAPFLAHFETEDVTIAPIALTGLDLHTYHRLERDPRLAGRVGFTDAAGLEALLRRLVAQHRPDLVYMLGIQPFVRLCKQMPSLASGMPSK
jgi:dihydrofolate synthase/folylpolyglutamate synthase